MSTLLLSLVSVSLALPPADTQWELLSDGDVRVECATVAGEPWCRSVGLVPLPVEQVANTLEHMAEFQDLFESIVSIRVFEPDTMQITLDFPAIMSDRDYVAKFTRQIDGDVRTYRWEPVDRADAPAQEGVVRLPKMAGEWRLEPTDSHTRVTYLWHAEIAGSFPDALLSRARDKAGREALKDIQTATRAAASR